MGLATPQRRAFPGGCPQPRKSATTEQSGIASRSQASPTVEVPGNLPSASYHYSRERSACVVFGVVAFGVALRAVLESSTGALWRAERGRAGTAPSGLSDARVIRRTQEKSRAR